MRRIVEPEVMDTVEAAEAYDAMEHGEVDRAFVDRVVALGASTGHFLDIGTVPHRFPSASRSAVPISTSPPLTYRRNAEDSETSRRRRRSHRSDNP